MIKLFKKKLKGTIENQCSEEKVLTPEVEEVVQEQIVEEKSFFSAEDALEKTSQQWKNIPTEEIFEKINQRIRFGSRSAYFSESIITEEQKLLLEDLGYTVEVRESTIYRTPCVSIEW